MQKSNDFLWLIVVAAVIWFMSQQNKPAPTPTPGGELSRIVTDAQDRAVLSAFYRDFADVVARDSTPMTNGLFEVWHTKSAEMLLQGTPLFAKYTGLGQAVAGKLAAGIGDQDTTLDRAKLSTTLLGISRELGS